MGTMDNITTRTFMARPRKMVDGSDYYQVVRKGNVIDEYLTLNVAHWNARSLNVEKMEALLNVLSIPPDVIVITESWGGMPDLVGYTKFGQTKKQIENTLGRIAMGVTVYVNSNLYPAKVRINEWLVILSIKSGPRTVNIIGIY